MFIWKNVKEVQAPGNFRRWKLWRGSYILQESFNREGLASSQMIPENTWYFIVW